MTDERISIAKKQVNAALSQTGGLLVSGTSAQVLSDIQVNLERALQNLNESLKQAENDKAKQDESKGKNLKQAK